jgi:hypothetical protein
MPVILVAWEAENRRIEVKARSGNSLPSPK